MISRRISKATF